MLHEITFHVLFFDFIRYLIPLPIKIKVKKSFIAIEAVEEVKNKNNLNHLSPFSCTIDLTFQIIKNTDDIVFCGLSK